MSQSSDEESIEGDGLPYLGEYEGDRNEREERHGQGRARLPNQDTYEGSYEFGTRNGKGIYRSGARYVGYYISGKKNGEGTFYYPDGSKYEGDWINDEKHGWGTYIYPNKDVYEGEWLNDKRHGQGTYIYAQTGSTYEGTWVQGKMQNAGQLVHTDHRYIGTFVDNKPKGKGKYLFDMGCEMRGNYSWIEKEIDDLNDEEVDEPEVEVRWTGQELCHVADQ